MGIDHRLAKTSDPLGDDQPVVQRRAGKARLVKHTTERVAHQAGGLPPAQVPKRGPRLPPFGHRRRRGQVLLAIGRAIELCGGMLLSRIEDRGRQESRELAGRRKRNRLRAHAACTKPDDHRRHNSDQQRSGQAIAPVGATV